MEPISWNNMARFAQKPHGSYYPENPPMAPMSAAQQQERYRIETHSKILPYVIRDHSWNFDSHDGTNFGKYKTDAPQAYAAEVDYVLPHPTNIPSEADPLLPCTPAEELEWAAEKSAAAAAGLPKPDAWCESSVVDPDPVEDDQAATDEATAAENTGAEAAANGTTPAAASATAHKKTKAHVPKATKGSAKPKSGAAKSQKEVTASKQSTEAKKVEAKKTAKDVVAAPIQEQEVTAAIDHDEKSHAAIKTKEDKHATDPNDIAPKEE
jgi:hypothetical protein